MEIQYQNLTADLVAYYHMLRSPRKSAERHSFYFNVTWHLAVLGLACYLALKYGEVFAACVFLALAGFYLKQNWSFEKHMNAQVDAYAAAQSETSNRLTLDKNGVQETFSGMQLSVAWSDIHGFTLVQKRLFLHFQKDRAFVIPLRHLTTNQREEFINALASYGVSQRV